MLPLTEAEIRASLVNASQREQKSLTLPADFAGTGWDKLDYLGWRDPKFPGIGYVITQVDGAPVGMLLRQSDGRIRTRPQCAWCEDIHLPNEVVIFSAKRSGAAGRNGNTIATMVCSNFECSRNVRQLPPIAYIGFDVEAARTKRIEVLGEHVRAFLRDVRDGRPRR